MVIDFHFVWWGWVGGIYYGEGVRYVCGWVFVSGGVGNNSFYYIGIGVCYVCGDVVGRDKLFP